MSRFLNNSKVLLFIIAVLLVTNIVMIAFFSVKHCGREENPRFSPGEAMRVSLMEEVKFSPEQLRQFDSLRQEHRKKIKPLFKNMNAVKDGFYLHIRDNSFPDSLLYKELDSIAVMQKQLDKTMFYHFRKVRTLCTPEQLPRYDSMAQQLIKRITQPFRKPAPHGKDTKDFSYK